MYMLCCVGYLRCITHYNRWKNGSPVSWVLVTMTFTSLAAFISKIIKTKRTVCSLPKGLINLTQAAQCTLYKDVCVFGLIVVIVKMNRFKCIYSMTLLYDINMKRNRDSVLECMSPHTLFHQSRGGEPTACGSYTNI